MKTAKKTRTSARAKSKGKNPRRAKRASRADPVVPLVVPSPSLAKLIGRGPFTREAVTKKIFMYLKRKDLFDSQNKSYLYPDARMRDALDCGSRISIFELTKRVNSQLREKPLVAATNRSDRKRPVEGHSENPALDFVAKTIGTALGVAFTSDVD